MKTEVNTSKLSKFANFKNAVKEQMIQFSTKLEKSLLDNPECRKRMIFGPIPSRRFGNVLIINNVLCRKCTYNCVYCQSGGADCCSTDRASCVNPYQLYFYVRHKLEELEKANINVDYIGFIPSGEATLDLNLAKEIELMRELGFKVIAFTNSSLIWNSNVRENLMFADIVNIKIDTVDEEMWLKINKPHKRLDFELILQGIKEFSKTYGGRLTTETMLIKDMNDNLEDLGKTIEFLKTIRRNVSYFSIPVRPTNKDYALAPDKEKLETIKVFIKENLDKIGLLCCADAGEVTVTGNFEDELLGILSVHPMKEEEVLNIYTRYGIPEQKFADLVISGKVERTVFNEDIFYTNKN